MTDPKCVENGNGTCMFCGTKMSDPNVIIEANPERNNMKTYQVEYNATYWVEANSEEEAIEKAIDVHSDMPDGDWNAFIDPYDSNNFNTLGEK